MFFFCPILPRPSQSPLCYSCLSPCDPTPTPQADRTVTVPETEPRRKRKRRLWVGLDSDTTSNLSTRNNKIPYYWVYTVCTVKSNHPKVLMPSIESNITKHERKPYNVTSTRKSEWSSSVKCTQKGTEGWAI